MDVAKNRGTLMMVSFLTLIAAGMGFATRAASGGAWADEFNIGGADFGMIMGAGFTGFGVFIFLGGMLVEAIGYKRLLLLAVVLHIVSAVMLLYAPSYYESVKASDPEGATAAVTNLLFWSVFLFAVCNGLYEAVINPLVGQLYPENQTHYLNILHAGWPGGLIVGGILAFCFQNSTAAIAEVPWHYALATYSVVLVVLLLMSVKESFPDTVTQGGKVSYGVLFSCFAAPPFLLLIVLHALIGFMELGVDSWQTRLMENLVSNSVMVLIYTSFLMFALRFFAGPIVHKINPIGLLLLSSVLAVAGLLWLSTEISTVAVIFAAATLYALGKAFLWPTMLAVAGERYPQCGAVAMSALGGAGMLSVGLIGGELIGVWQSQATTAHLETNHPEVYKEFKAPETNSFPSWGKTMGLKMVTFEELIADKQQSAMENADDPNSQIIKDAFTHGGRTALAMTALLPTGMAIGFFILLLYYRSQGGYKVLELGGDAAVGDGGAEP